MKLYIVAVVLLAVMYFAGNVQPASAYCSLERMKKYAIEACEHLLHQDDTREKRSLGRPNEIWDSDFETVAYKHHYVSRSIFPNGGYLKVDHSHFNKLSQVDVHPRYKARKLHQLFGERSERGGAGTRFKREHAPSYNNIPYCCYNRCEEDFFC